MGYSPWGQKVRHDLVTKQHVIYNSSFYSFQVYGWAALSTLTCKHHLHRVDFSPDCNLGPHAHPVCGCNSTSMQGPFVHSGWQREGRGVGVSFLPAPSAGAA